MKYRFTINTTASDLWQLSMYGIYGSILGAANAVFTAVMVLLAVRFFFRRPYSIEMSADFRCLFVSVNTAAGRLSQGRKTGEKHAERCAFGV